MTSISDEGSCRFPNPYGRLPVISTPSRPANSSIEPLAACSTSGVTPACVESLYGIPTTKATSPSNQLAVSGFIGEFANQADLTVSYLRSIRDSLYTYSRS